MIYIVGMQMPKNCQECPFLYAGIYDACCIARARYEAQDGKWGIAAQRLWDGNDKQRDSDCPLCEDSEVEAALTEFARLKRKFLKGETSANEQTQ